MNNDQIEKILQNEREVLANIEKALEAAGLPVHLIPLYAMYFPDFKRLLPEDAVTLFKQIQQALIIYLDSLGYSQREIVKRMGGSSTATISRVLGKIKTMEENIKLGSIDDVMKEEGDEDAATDGQDI